MKLKESFGDSLLASFLAVILLLFLFMGDPNIATSARVWVGKAAGTIPADYVYQPKERG